MPTAIEANPSTPGFDEFDPCAVPYQSHVIDDIKHEFDYSKGMHEVLLSGSVGSAKSILMAHIIVRHCLEFPGARVLIGRRHLPDLRDTLYRKIVEHLAATPNLKKFWTAWDTSCRVRFRNNSEIFARTWGRKDYGKFGSLEISAAAFEELTENDDEDKQAYDIIGLRVGRLPHIPEQFVISATNPDSPAHWVYEHFKLKLDEGVENPDPHRDHKHVYYSQTIDNPFLPPSYLERIKANYDPRMFMRMGKGRWIEITKEVIYYNYDRSVNFISHKDYEVDDLYPVWLTFDFNIGIGKPMSATAYQHINGKFYFFSECVVEGADTEELLMEWANRGIFDHGSDFYITGDATGKSRAPGSKVSNYQVIQQFLDNYRHPFRGKVDYEMKVPRSNPPIMTRHNEVNSAFKNTLGQVSVLVYSSCPTLDKGFRLTALKKGARYIEDDSKPFQHVTTAAGYGILVSKTQAKRRPAQQKRAL